MQNEFRHGGFSTLWIEYLGEKSLGNCRTLYRYQIHSRNPLSDEIVRKLATAGVIGGGQEFKILERGVDKRLPRQFLSEDALATETGPPPTPYWVTTEYFCDSGD